MILAPTWKHNAVGKGKPHSVRMLSAPIRKKGKIDNHANHRKDSYYDSKLGDIYLRYCWVRCETCWFEIMHVRDGAGRGGFSILDVIR